MKILVIGSGGREHALVWKLRQSPRVEHVWCAPGNGGISQHAECVAAEVHDVAALAGLAAKLGADLTLVGPELPLVLGIVDEFEKRGLRIVGPSRAAAQLEGSKVFAKEFLERHSIPAASTYGIYDTPGDAYSALCAVDWPCVIKADGLCAGKGVLVAPGPDDATAFIDRLMEKREFGPAGERVILEEALAGEELSYIVLTDGTNVIPMAPTRDHKRVFDGDQGPNTGGMGAYSAPDLLPLAVEKTIRETIVEPAIRGMAADGCPYKGFLYFGLMLTPEGPKVLEFNCRLGDPETQAIVARMDFDLGEALEATVEGKLAGFQPKWKPEASVCVVIASGGYPGGYVTGLPIQGLDKTDLDVAIFHAGTKHEGDTYYTSGGRVLGVTGTGSDVAKAAASAYDNISRIAFKDIYFRCDIGLPRSESAAGG
jgi:phosphoribosylamine--glycine ligase